MKWKSIRTICLKQNSSNYEKNGEQRKLMEEQRKISRKVMYITLVQNYAGVTRAIG